MTAMYTPRCRPFCIFCRNCHIGVVAAPSRGRHRWVTALPLRIASLGSMRSAVIDLGSNTFHVLVADVDRLGIRNVTLDRKVATRIGALASARRIPLEAYERGLSALGALLTRTRLPDAHRIVATGVFREAPNARAFLAEACQRYRISIEVIS